LKKVTIKDSIPDSNEGLKLFIKECDKEIKKFNKLRDLATKKLDVLEGKPTYGLNLT
jgi:hypothetical protein